MYLTVEDQPVEMHRWKRLLEVRDAEMGACSGHAATDQQKERKLAATLANLMGKQGKRQDCRTLRLQKRYE